MRIPQHSIRWLGACVESLYMVLPMLSVINFISVTILLWGSAKETIQEYAPWVSFWIFLLGFGTVAAVSMLFAWVLLVPSIWAVRGQQMFGKETRGNNGDGVVEVVSREKTKQT